MRTTGPVYTKQIINCAAVKQCTRCDLFPVTRVHGGVSPDSSAFSLHYLYYFPIGSLSLLFLHQKRQATGESRELIAGQGVEIQWEGRGAKRGSFNPINPGQVLRHRVALLFLMHAPLCPASNQIVAATRQCFNDTVRCHGSIISRTIKRSLE